MYKYAYLIYYISLRQNSKLSHVWENSIRCLILEASDSAIPIWCWKPGLVLESLWSLIHNGSLGMMVLLSGKESGKWRGFDQKVLPTLGMGLRLSIKATRTISHFRLYSVLWQVDSKNSHHNMCVWIQMHSELSVRCACGMLYVSLDVYSVYVSDSMHGAFLCDKSVCPCMSVIHSSVCNCV